MLKLSYLWYQSRSMVYLVMLESEHDLDLDHGDSCLLSLDLQIIS